MKALPITLLNLTRNFSRRRGQQSESKSATGSIDSETLSEGFITESDALSDMPITDIKLTVSINSSSIELLGKKTN